MVIAKNDFERYEIILPLNALAGKRRDSFLCSELEKMHPCFSDEFCFDTMFRKISRKGLCTDVLVMSKNKLAEYESKRHFYGKGFKLEGEKHHRFFIDKKFAVTAWMILGCLLVAVVGLFSGAVTGKINSKKNVQLAPVDVASESGEIFEEKLQVDSDSENLPFLGELFINNVAKLSGKITSFEWGLDGFTETLNACVEGIYPEGLEKSLMPQNVTYVNGIPKFTISCIDKKKIPAAQDSSSLLYDINSADFNVQMRQLIAKNGAVLREEKTEPYRVLFSCSSKAEAVQLFKELSNLIENNHKEITFIRLVSEQPSKMTSSLSSNVSTKQPSSLSSKLSSGLMVELSMESIPVKGFDLKLIFENMNLFFEEKSINQKAAVQTAIVPFVNKKVGEIKRPDNSKIVFYKNQNGKMEKIILAADTEDSYHE